MRPVLRAALLVLVALVVAAVLPSDLWAWSPGTHVFLGESVLASLSRLPQEVAAILAAFPKDFLYGSIAADTSFAKKYAPVGRHSHAWHLGQEIADLAGSPQLRAFGLGYLAHLAADVVAHNFFVPRQLVVTSSSRALGHSYWEARFDMHLGESYARAARELILMDHSADDEHLDRIISPTIFSVRTNRRLFRGMVQLTDTASWVRVVRLAAEASRWDLPDRDVERHLAVSFDFVMDFLIRGDTAQARRFDPSGAAALASAKRMRHHALRAGGRRDVERVLDTADEHFGLPRQRLGHWDGMEAAPAWGAARGATRRARR
jgi:hypothetical protein